MSKLVVAAAAGLSILTAKAEDPLWNYDLHGADWTMMNCTNTDPIVYQSPWAVDSE